ncbi:hypothetical protein Ciccas_011784 [Cichlidogyrus casuarinus]|uniref:Uncharacterized protein n=1 Tax=Cichlidogyrus casuarinus TaxID=1844966 RepID=A0ABD2PQA0_9PLAT
MYYKNRYGATQEGGQLSEHKLEQIIAASSGPKKDESACYSSPDGSSDEAINMAESSTEWSALSTSPGSPPGGGKRRVLNPGPVSTLPKMPKLHAQSMEDFANCWKQLCSAPKEEKKRPFTVEATLAAEDD